MSKKNTLTTSSYSPLVDTAYKNFSEFLETEILNKISCYLDHTPINDFVEFKRDPTAMIMDVAREARERNAAECSHFEITEDEFNTLIVT